ncbi:MAG: hypothetical protein K9J16_07430 [Melioribacteraceae bacterium]|nr:hypothetical protein [Melioribacteraceae bacterium]MCF8353424.1 hypothetical protein [Melioribacteraceae bacterium]MCF8393912.1 hypothetical protein [Melioribacteraceae bacterium]MCF8418985.1 hypothetical protein [Melioribacteraceae bacterium]
MQFVHEFQNPRNLYEKLIRDYEQLDMVISGDNIFNFVTSAYLILEWVKKCDVSEGMKRFLKRASSDKNVKICKDILFCKKKFTVFIEDPNLEDGSEFKHKRRVSEYDIHAYKNGTKKFLLRIDDEEYDPFQFKEDIIELYDVYFKLKGYSRSEML